MKKLNKQYKVTYQSSVFTCMHNGGTPILYCHEEKAFTSGQADQDYLTSIFVKLILEEF
jgi:hypothetical protein